MKKIFLMPAIICFMICLTAVQCHAEKKFLNVSIESVAGDKGTAVADILRKTFTNDAKKNSVFSLTESFDQTEYYLRVIIGDVKIYEAKSEKSRVMELLRKSIGKDENGNDTNLLTDAEKRSAVEELKDISKNPIVGKFTADVIFSAISSGEPLFSQTFEVRQTGQTADEALDKACKEFSEGILTEAEQKLPTDKPAATPEPTPAPTPTTPTAPQDFLAKVGDMMGDMIYIDKGTASGIQIGDKLTIIRSAGDIVIDGKVVGKKEMEIGKAEVVEVNENYSACKVTSKNGDVKQGDIVRK